MIGKTISHYRILDKLGEGGMGVVYRAQDSKLGRTVALKVLPSDRISSPQARERFEREAKVVASLNHPHICTLHDFANENGTDFLVMEYVEGKPLKGPVPLDRALEVGAQIADAPDHAHRHGVVHRDIKPGNVMVTKSGVKLLDFGLAKVSASDPENDLTRTAGITNEGTILGTFHYMSPEQWEGTEADARSDIFSFGALLYELLTGRRAFEGKSQASLVAAITEKDPPPVSSVEPVSPPALDRVVQKCLEKDPDKRWQSAADLGDELRWIHESGAEALTAVPRPALRVKLRLLWLLLALITIVFSALLLVRFRDSSTAPALRRFALTPPVSLNHHDYMVPVAISPNGKHIAFTVREGEGRLWIWDLDREQPRQIEGTSGANSPFWSPGSDFAAFATSLAVHKVSVEGGPVIKVCDLPDRNLYRGSWSPDGNSIVFSSGVPTAALYEVSSSGGTANLLVATEDSEPSPGRLWGNIDSPHFLPAEAGARVLAFTIGSGTEKTMVVQDLETGQNKFLGPGFTPTYSPSGHIVYQSAPGNYALWALPFSLSALEVTGEAFPVAERSRYPSIAADQTLVYSNTQEQRHHQLVWLDRRGNKRAQISGLEDGIRYLTLSPDQQLVSVATGESDSSQELWVHDLSRGVRTRLISGMFVEASAWSPTGEEVAFTSWGAGGHDISLRQANGSGDVEALVTTQNSKIVCDWSGDGKYLLYQLRGSDRNTDLWYLKRNEDGSGWEPRPFLQTPFDELAGQFSPDGRYVAYVSNESGQLDVYVTPFPSGRGKWTVSGNGGRQPRWDPDGKELFYVEGDTLMVVPVATSPSLSLGAVMSLFEYPGLASGSSPQYEVSNDGQRFITRETPEQPSGPIMRLVQNWYEEFRD